MYSLSAYDLSLLCVLSVVCIIVYVVLLYVCAKVSLI